MQSTESPIAHFFRAFERNSRSIEDCAPLVAQFAATFLAATPQGAQCQRASDFAALLPRRVQIFAQLGWRSTELASLREDWLDSRYALVRTEWRFTFTGRGKDSESALAASTFLIDAGAQPFRILAYLSHDDIVQTMRDRGGAAY